MPGTRKAHKTNNRNQVVTPDPIEADTRRIMAIIGPVVVRRKLPVKHFELKARALVAEVYGVTYGEDEQ